MCEALITAVDMQISVIQWKIHSKIVLQAQSIAHTLLNSAHFLSGKH